MVWNGDDRINQIILECLLKANGVDGGAGSFNQEDWQIYTQEYFDRIGIKSGDTVFDFGCGSGAFIYPLYLKMHTVGG